VAESIVALRFFKKAIQQHGLPAKVTIDKTAAPIPRLEALEDETSREIEIRQIEFLNNLVEQDH
jgi:putative transposase